jgi:uncharacterized protein YndB with AHSA1/START domain
VPAPRSETDDVLEYEVRVAARPETVFAYFTDPAKMIQWMGTEATLDPRPGGICRINPTGALAMLGEFVEIDPPRRIVFTWGWEREMFATPPQSTVVEVSFTPDANGTIIHLAHRRLLPGAVRFHQAGWDHYLPRLAVVAAGGDPSRDPWQDPEKALRDLALSPSPEAE